MMVDDAMLLAFVDNELDPASREKVEAVLAHNPERQAQVAALSASCLPYRAAFEHQVLPELPRASVERVNSLVSVSQAPFAALRSRRHWFGVGAAIAASFASGVLLPWRMGWDDNDSGWVKAIANYQSMYVRDTVEQAADSADRLSTLISGFDGEQRQALFVPDLRAANLTFKRVQRLGYGNLPLIQMVYLPVSGKPVALCALPMKRADSAVQTRLVDGLSVASWHRHGIAFVFAAEMPRRQVAELAQRLAEDGFARL